MCIRDSTTTYRQLKPIYDEYRKSPDKEKYLRGHESEIIPVSYTHLKALEDAYRTKMKDAEPKKEGAEKALPELTEGQTLSVAAAIIKEGKSSPPQHFTEDTLLSAMETAGKEDMPEDAERKGLGRCV